jgi:hypothetical protein
MFLFVLDYLMKYGKYIYFLRNTNNLNMRFETKVNPFQTSMEPIEISLY